MSVKKTKKIRTDITSKSELKKQKKWWLMAILRVFCYFGVREGGMEAEAFRDIVEVSYSYFEDLFFSTSPFRRFLRFGVWRNKKLVTLKSKITRYINRQSESKKDLKGQDE